MSIRRFRTNSLANVYHFDTRLNQIVRTDNNYPIKWVSRISGRVARITLATGRRATVAYRDLETLLYPLTKFELTNDTIEVDGITLYRIRALVDFSDVKAGDVGGYVQSESNLSQEGKCWVYDNAAVYGNAQVYGIARVYNNAQVYGNAKVCGDALVVDNARVYGDANVYDTALVADNAWVYDNARVYNNAQVYGNARVYNNAQVYGNAYVSEYAKVRDKAQVFDTAIVSGNAIVCGTATVCNTRVGGSSVKAAKCPDKSQAADVSNTQPNVDTYHRDFIAFSATSRASIFCAAGTSVESVIQQLDTDITNIRFVDANTADELTPVASWTLVKKVDQ